MQKVVLPGRRKVEIREFPVSEPGHGQVLILMKASSTCGSDSQTSYTAALTIFEVAHE
jgi:threonine dehydrogenase-like Zn-dependent dehydrogenase